MPYTHRGMLTGDNHRSTPRLAQMMARRMTQDVREGSPLSHGNTREFTPAEAQKYLNQYRTDRDMYGTGDYKGVSDKAQQIYNALYFERHGY